MPSNEWLSVDYEDDGGDLAFIEKLENLTTDILEQ